MAARPGYRAAIFEKWEFMNLVRMPIHVAIVESDEAILSELQQLIDGAGNLRCVCASTSAEEALERIPGIRPQIVIMGLGLPGICGIECTILLKRELEDAQVLIYSSQSAVESISRAFQAGAGGYILKRPGHGELVHAVRELASGGAPMTAGIARTLVQSLRKTIPRHEPGSRESLTPREEEILGCLTSGLVNKEIGDRLSISYDTVRHHLKNIYTKLGVRTRTEAVVKHLRGSALSGAGPQSVRCDSPGADRPELFGVTVAFADVSTSGVTTAVKRLG